MVEQVNLLHAVPARPAYRLSDWEGDRVATCATHACAPLVEPVIRTLYGGAMTVLLPAVAATACTLTHTRLELRAAAAPLLQPMARPDVLACSACMFHY